MSAAVASLLAQWPLRLQRLHPFFFLAALAFQEASSFELLRIRLLLQRMSTFTLDSEWYEMLLDKETDIATLKGGPVAWYSDPDWRCDGMDNRIFAHGEVPMKFVLKEIEHADSTPEEMKAILEVCPVAAYWYARAFNANQVKGPPVALFRVRLSMEAQSDGLHQDTLLWRPAQHTLAFKRPINHDNYPELTDLVVHYFAGDTGKMLLQIGQDLVAKKIIIPGLNDSQKRRKF